MTCSTSYLFYYTLMDPWNVPITCVCVCVRLYICNMYETMISKSVSMSTSIVTPDSLIPFPSTSAPIMNSDPPALIFQHPRQKLNRLQTNREGTMIALNQQL